MAKKSIVVLGAGFGGLRAAMDAAKGLRARKLLDAYEVVLVDRSDCHLYTPLLYMAAAPLGNETPDLCTYDITTLIKGLPIRFVQSEVAAIDLPNGDVHLKNGEELKADFLVMALGSETNYFGIPGLQENSLPMKTIEQAVKIKETVFAAFKKSGDVKIMVGGAGANGIELSAELRMLADKEQKKDKNLRVTISLLEAMPTILPGLDAGLQKIAAARLARLGVQVMVNGKITAVGPGEIAIDGTGKIPFDVFIWTGGIRTPDIITQLPLSKEPHGKPMAESGMVCLPATPDLKLYPMVYAIGDSVCFMNPKTKRPVPAVARAAITEGAVAAHNVLEEIKKAMHPTYTPKYRKYVPWDYPYVIPIGKNWAVAKAGPFVFAGTLAVIFKDLIELDYLTSVLPFWSAVKIWME